MKKLLAITAVSLPFALASGAWAQDTTAPATPAPSTTAPSTTAPSTTAPSTTAPATQDLAPATGTPGNSMPTETVSGWSVKDKIGKAVHNENDEKVGDIKDVVVASDGKAAYFIVGAGGFLGMGEHEVAIPYEEITGTDKLMLQGYTKDQLKALPRVEVAK